MMLFGQKLTLIAMIGILLLIGIVKKNAIMMIDFALDAQRHQGMAPEQAIREACILMAFFFTMPMSSKMPIMAISVRSFPNSISWPSAPTAAEGRPARIVIGWM